MRLKHAFLAASIAALAAQPAFAQLQPTTPTAPAQTKPATPPATTPATPPATTPTKPATPPTATAPTTPTKPVATTPAPAVKLVNLNSATAEELDQIPNIGDKRSAAIIAARPYTKADDLVTKKVLTQGIYDKIKDKVTVKVNLNTATADDLDSLPGIGDKRSAAIIAARPFKKADDLVTKKVLTQGVYDKIKAYVDVK